MPFLYASEGKVASIYPKKPNSFGFGQKIFAFMERRRKR
jgi:hypothetical protein